MDFNPAKAPSWVSGSAGDGGDGSIRKFHRAVKFLKDTNQPITEEAVKELYIKMGGLVIGNDDTIRGIDLDASDTSEEAPAPRRGRKPKTEE